MSYLVSYSMVYRRNCRDEQIGDHEGSSPNAPCFSASVGDRSSAKIEM